MTMAFTGEEFGTDTFDRMPAYDPMGRAHMWILAPLYQVDPDRRHVGQRLGPENLMLIVGPFCYHCDAVGDEYAVGTPCPGPPPEPAVADE